MPFQPVRIASLNAPVNGAVEIEEIAHGSEDEAEIEDLVKQVIRI